MVKFIKFELSFLLIITQSGNKCIMKLFINYYKFIIYKQETLINRIT